MDEANYAPLAPRLSQGDIVRAPIGVFARLADLAAPPPLKTRSEPLTYGDPAGVTLTIPWRPAGRADAGAGGDAEDRLVLRAWYAPAVVVTPDCGIDKEPRQILLAPILPLAALAPADRDGVRAGTFLMALYLPADPAMVFADGSTFAFPDSCVDFTRTTAVTPGLLAGQRMVALSDAQRDRFQEAWVRFLAGREISSTGTLAAAAGKRVRAVDTLESSRRRHTVLFTFDDDSIAVVYQEPRRRGGHLQEVRVRNGAFDPPEVQALAGSHLVLRFENEDRRDWNLACPELGLDACRLAAASTTPVLVRCPAEPGELRLANRDKRGTILRLRLVAPPTT